MNYIKEINAFESLLRTKKVSPTAQLLWYRLMALANVGRWEPWIEAGAAYLLDSLSTTEGKLRRARTELMNLGLLTYCPPRGKTAAKYQLHSLWDMKPQTTAAKSACSAEEGDVSCSLVTPQTSSQTEGHGQKKEKNQKKENKYIYKQNQTKGRSGKAVREPQKYKYDYDMIERLSFLAVTQEGGM